MLSELFENILKNWIKATGEQFSGHPLAMKLRDDLKNLIQKKLSEQGINYKIKASAGAGNWANVPWLSMLSPDMTQSTQEGIYPVYLFRADGTGLYLSLGFGTTNLKKIYGTVKAKEEAELIAKHIHKAFPEINTWGDVSIDLRASTELGKSYEWGSAGAKFYPVHEIPADDILLKDLFELIDIYKKIPADFVNSLSEQSKEEVNPKKMIDVTRLPKPFILLAGISGTGKTRFVREQASAVDSSGNNYCLVSVRPDWHEPSDLLGYVSRLSGKPEYVSTKLLDFIIRAWQMIAPSADAQGTGELDLSAVPYWLCLDEMNLAPVEQYFADYLSVLETRKFEDGEYSCEALLDESLLKDLSRHSGNELQKTLGLENNNNLWEYFLNYGISIPPNLIVAGTVNMDETTHGFSRKVIDRALTIDFGEFFPNDYDRFFQSDSKIKPLTYSLLTQASENDLSATIDGNGGKSIAFLAEVNTILRQTPFELAYRALNELLLQVACSKPHTEAHLQAVWDDFLMSKVLPRIDGDEDKLRNINDDSADNLLDSLFDLLEKQLSLIWNDTRLDLYREKIDGSVIEDISCRSKAKLLWMKNRLEVNTFTSYWP